MTRNSTTILIWTNLYCLANVDILIDDSEIDMVTRYYNLQIFRGVYMKLHRTSEIFLQVFRDVSYFPNNISKTSSIYFIHRFAFNHDV